MVDKVLSFQEISGELGPAAGGKGGSLARLFQAGFPVPDGFVLMPAAFEGDTLRPESKEQAGAYLERMRQAIPGTSFAVRSSAMGEDSLQASFAGEFESRLNVQSDDEIWQAVHAVRRSRHSERVQAYSRGKGLQANQEIAVVVQQLVRAECSGVLFTANPVTGQRDQVMISAAWGLGEAIVGGKVTPDTVIIDKATGRVTSYEVADKHVMTVLVKNHTEEQPVPESKHREPVLSDDEASELARLGMQIEALFGLPMDIEWTRSAGRFAIVQARPITSLPEPEPQVAADWKLPKGAYIAIRNNIVELMADPLSPLFETFGLAAVNSSLDRLLADFFGKPGLMPERLIISVNRYAYYNGSLSAGQMGRILLGSIGIARRMFTGAVERWTEIGRPAYIAIIEDWDSRPWREMPSIEIMEAARQLAEAAIDAYGALVGGVIPAAWISEGLFTLVYNTLIKRRDDPPAPVYLMGYDSTPILAEKSLYDLALWAKARPGLAAYLSKTSAEQLSLQIECDQTPTGLDADEWHSWQERFQAHLDLYGHMIYNLDFANPVPADDPTPLLDTSALFLRGEGANPHARQVAAAERRERAVQVMTGRLKGWRLRLFRKFLDTAQRFAPLREDGLADIGMAYPTLRQMLLAVGSRLAQAGAIPKAEDIFWMDQAQGERAVALLEGGEALDDLSAIITERKAAWRAAKRFTPPRALPQMKVFGVDLAEMKSRRRRGKAGATLKGVAASPGKITAPARLVYGPEDFSQLQAGDVLVTAITTPAWTPLFARAAAIVTDVGGPLSHGSIVAREYGIPAVLGTGSATQRIRSGQLITVDGSTGLVTLDG